MFQDDSKNQQKPCPEEVREGRRRQKTWGSGSRISHSHGHPVAKLWAVKDSGRWGLVFFFFAHWSFSLAKDATELIEGFRKPVAFLLAPGGSCRLWQTPPCPAYGDALNRVNRRLEYIACDGKTVIQKTLRSWSAFFPPTAENAFEKQHLKHVRKETVCLSECDFLGSRIYP